jgi:hypothetical protein
MFVPRYLSTLPTYLNQSRTSSYPTLAACRCAMWCQPLLHGIHKGAIGWLTMQKNEDCSRTAGCPDYTGVPIHFPDELHMRR